MKNFMIGGDSIKCILQVPVSFNPYFDSVSLKKHIVESKLNKYTIPEGKMLFCYVDSINHFTLSAILYEKDQPSRRGYDLFTNFKNLDEIINYLRDNTSKRENNDLNKVISVDLHANLLDSSIMERDFIWSRNSKIMDPKSPPEMFYVESIISRKRDISFYFTLPSTSFDKADSIIACHFKEPISKTVHFLK